MDQCVHDLQLVSAVPLGLINERYELCGQGLEPFLAGAPIARPGLQRHGRGLAERAHVRGARLLRQRGALAALLCRRQPGVRRGGVARRLVVLVPLLLEARVGRIALPPP